MAQREKIHLLADTNLQDSRLLSYNECSVGKTQDDWTIIKRHDPQVARQLWGVLAQCIRLPQGPRIVFSGFKSVPSICMIKEFNLWQVSVKGVYGIKEPFIDIIVRVDLVNVSSNRVAAWTKLSGERRCTSYAWRNMPGRLVESWKRRLMQPSGLVQSSKFRPSAGWENPSVEFICRQLHLLEYGETPGARSSNVNAPADRH